MKFNVLTRISFLLLIMCIAVTIQNTLNPTTKKTVDKRFIAPYSYKSLNSYYRPRATSKPGFFKTLFSVMFEQWNDTKNTTRFINQMVNDNFLPENAPVTQSTPSSNPNVSTTEAPYKIKRSEFLRILRRNIKGINRLYNIEFKDAMRASHRTYANFKRNVSMEVSKFL